MWFFGVFVFLIVIISPALSVVPNWGQCGGIGWTGDTVCAPGSFCFRNNDYWFQCRIGTPPEGTPVPTPIGFVKTSGTRFTLNGAPYSVVGGNAYWIGLTGLNNIDKNAAFADIAKAGGTTVRTWGFNEGTATGGNLFQSWSGSTPTIQVATLANFDYVVAAAKNNGLHLIVALTNNWADYGGMDVYVNQIVGPGQPHDLFYTDPRVIAAFKNYVKVIVTRYVNESTIMAWELANEPRCRGSTGTTTGTCTPETITNWAKDISAFIKTIDPNHLVALGDEGFYNHPNSSNYPYQYDERPIHCVPRLIVFMVGESYPGSWGQADNSLAWGTQWIVDHVASQDRQGKPVILEEFGVTTDQSSVYTAWFDQIASSGLAGDLIWQSGSHLASGSTPDDGFAVYPDHPVYSLLTSHALDMGRRT